jgi:lipid IVA palmitoyltransferase
VLKLINKTLLNIAICDFQTNKKIYKFAFSFIFLTPALVFADDGIIDSTWLSIKNELSETWASPNAELYIPINTWHNRNYYTSDEIDDFNERPWGLGAGKYRYDEDGDWHGIYAFAFLDSQSDVEPIAGYGFQKIWRTSENVRFGFGYTAGVTLRKDSDYIPIPVLAPLFSVKYKQVALQSTYILGGNGYGNVLFSWLRWEIP